MGSPTDPETRNGPATGARFGWNAAFVFVPDLSLTVAVVGALAVLTGLARATQLVSARSPRDADEHGDRTIEPEAVDFLPELSPAGTSRPASTVRQHT